MDMRGGSMKGEAGPYFFSKSAKGTDRLNFPSRRTNPYQQYKCLQIISTDEVIGNLTQLYLEFNPVIFGI